MGGMPSSYFCCVKLRGLPFGVQESEVGMFLGLDTIDILLVRHNGRASGEAFVVLMHPAELEAAMRKHKAYMGSRYIEVIEVRKHEYYNAVVSTFGTGGGGGGYGGGYGAGGGSHRGRSRSRSPTGDRAGGPPTTIVKLRGLPFSATIEDVSAFFADPTIGLLAPNPELVSVVTGHDGRPSGLAFVEFESPEAAAAAMTKHRQMMGTRYVEIFPSDVNERARYCPDKPAPIAAPVAVPDPEAAA